MNRNISYLQLLRGTSIYCWSCRQNITKVTRSELCFSVEPTDCWDSEQWVLCAALRRVSPWVFTTVDDYSYWRLKDHLFVILQQRVEQRKARHSLFMLLRQKVNYSVEDEFRTFSAWWTGCQVFMGCSCWRQRASGGDDVVNYEL